MVVKHYGHHPDLEQIREDCALGKDGVSLLGISNAAEKRGLHSLGGRITLETLANEAPLPCIAYWNQNHFVVVYKARKSRKGMYTIHVADPGKGLLTYTKVENLSFKYDIYSPTPILDNLNLTIPNGKVTAIVGASGSGKTTLIKRLLGYYSPLEGEIKVSGTELEEYNLSW